jgi:hypothetical protein
MGYNALYVILNFGFLCFGFTVVPLCWMLSPLLYCVFYGSLTHLKIKIDRMMFWNSWIELINQTYLFLGFCVFLNIIHYLHFDSVGNAINSLLSLFFASILLLAPIFVLLFYSRKKNERHILSANPEFRDKFGAFLKGLNFKRRGQNVLVYICATMIRRLILIFTIFFLR